MVFLLRSLDLGSVDIRNHAHPFGAFLKSHEDSLVCMDVLVALKVVMQTNNGQGMTLTCFVFDRAWAFNHANLRYRQSSRHATTA